MDNTSASKSDPDPLIGQVDFDNWKDYTNDEDLVNKYFYKLYVSQITTDQMIEVMQHLSNSPKGSRNRSVYNTMLKILFNECRFFPKYPLQELSITAELFGKMIKHGLLLSNGPLLLLASRCILEALKRGKTSKMFQFGTIALSQFENSIASYPWFSNSLLSIPDVKETFPQLYKTCEKLQTIMTDNMKNSTYIDQSKGIVIGQTEEPVQQQQISQVSQSNQQGYGLDIRSSVGEWELIMGDVDIEVKVPPDSVVDHVYSIFNNMCPDDVEKKAKEVSTILGQEYNSWLLLYLIRTRASKEHNLHDVFANFIENMNYPKLFDLAIQITYLCINSCLKNVEQYKEILAYRSLLKNLGSWLGRITLYRNVPIIHRQLDVKAVLTRGYENGYLLAVLPFICKTMENIKNSKIFKPPNPWTTAMLSFLMEIRDLPSLKTNLVFEVEVLFKHLNLEMSEYSNKTNLLASKSPPKNSPDFEPLGTTTLKTSASTTNLTSAKPQKGLKTTPSVSNLTTPNPLQQPGDREKLNQLLSKVIREGTVSTSSGLHTGAGVNSMVGTSMTGVQTTNLASVSMTNTAINQQNVVTPVASSSGVNLPGLGQGLVPGLVSGTSSVQGVGSNLNLPNTATFAHNQINMSMTRFIDNMMHNLHNSVVISPSIALFEIQPQFRALVPIAIERAVRHVLSVVCDHSLSLARMCTKTLVSKDFINEDDENVIRASTRIMFESLSTNLVVATCKEPLRVAFHESLRSSLQTHRTQDCNDQVLVEQLVQILSQDNLSVCVNVVEKITQEYTVRESDLLFMEVMKCIKRDPKLPTNFLPTPLSNWNTRNMHQQGLNTYKSIFTTHEKTPTTQQGHSPTSMLHPSISLNSLPGAPMGGPNMSSMTIPMPTMPGQLVGVPNVSSPTNQLTPAYPLTGTPTNGLHNVLTQFEECLSELREPLRDVTMFPPPFYNSGLEHGRTEHVFSTQSLHVLYSLPHDHEIFSSIIKCLNVVENSGCRELASMAISKCLLMFLCEGLGSNSGLNVEVLLCILDGLNSINPGVKQMLGNMLYSLPLDQSNNLFNIIVVTGLLRYKLLDWPDLTHYLILAMERGKNVYAIEMAIVSTAIALIDQKSAPPSVGAPLVTEIANLSCGSEPCKTYPGVSIKDAWSKLLKDFVEVQKEPKPTILVLTTILKQNLNTLMCLQQFKVGVLGLCNNTTTNVMNDTNLTRVDNLGLLSDTKSDSNTSQERYEEYMDGFGGSRRIPLPCTLNDSHKFVFGALFGKWIEFSRNVEGDSLLFSWRQFFQKFNLQSLFKMEGGTDSFFSSCLYTIIQFEKSSKLFNLTSKDIGKGINGSYNNTTQLNVQGLQSSENEKIKSPTSNSVDNVFNTNKQGESGVNTSNQFQQIYQNVVDNSPLDVKNSSLSRSASSSSSSSSGSSINSNVSITLFDCFEGLCKMVDVMLRLVGGVGDIPPCSALQKLLGCLCSIIVHEGHYVSCYNIWLSLMVYFDKLEEGIYMLSKLTFLYALEYINPTRVPGFSFFYLRLLLHPSLLSGSLKSTKCWPVLSRIFNLISIYTTEINNYSVSIKESSNSSVSGNDNFKDLLITKDEIVQDFNLNKEEFKDKDELGTKEVNEEEKENEFNCDRDPYDYIEYFTSVYFNCIEYISYLSPEFVNTNYLNFFGTFAIERLASSVGSYSVNVSGFRGIVSSSGVDLLPEMKVVPKISTSWTNNISRNRTSLLVSKVLGTLAKYGPQSLSNSQDFDTLCLILTEESNNAPAQAIMTFNSLTLEIVTTHPSHSPELLDSNARLVLFLCLIKSLTIKAKYQLVCSITRHLRGPNSHTFFFSCLLITMFEEFKTDFDTRHVILRVLLESFIAPGQCPWGVSLVVLELFRNPRFQHTLNYSPQTNALIESITTTLNNITV